jgi:osmotically-inducible protein OsmY
MRVFRNIVVLLAVVLAFSSVSIMAQSGSDAAIETQVRKKILKLPFYEVFDSIKFDVNGGTVTLYGKVYNARNKKDAEANVEDIPGVTRVVNNIKVLPPSNFDDSIRRDLYRSISNFGGLSRYLWTANPSVRLIVDHGHVSLEGYVSTKADADSMYVVANGVSGVFSVKNNLVVDRGRAH